MPALEKPVVASDESKWKGKVGVLGVVVGLFDFVAGDDLADLGELACQGESVAVAGCSIHLY